MLQVLKPYISYATLLCFIVSGLILNVAQLVVYILVRPFSQNLFRAINHCLQYSYWSQTVAVATWNSNLKCRLYFKDKKTIEEFGTTSGMVIANHRYDIDWLAAWMASDSLGTLGADKAIMKTSLRHVPVIGWGWSLSDMIFLSRNWQKDKENLPKAMEVLLTYPRSFLLSYFEGTRLTKTKYEASVKFAEEKNLPIRLKHHLIPRTRGFNCMIRTTKECFKRDPKLKYGLFNFEVALDNDDNSKASLSAVLGGTPSCVHIYVESINIDDIPTDSEEATSEFLFKIYEEKDRLFEHFLANGRFPGIVKEYKPRLQTLLNWVIWMLVVYLTLIYQYYLCFTSGSLLYVISLSTLGLSAILSIKMLLNSTKVSKSSEYGLSDKEKKK